MHLLINLAVYIMAALVSNLMGFLRPVDFVLQYRHECTYMALYTPITVDDMPLLPLKEAIKAKEISKH